MSDEWELYRRHLETLDGWLYEALERARQKGTDVEGVLFHAGRAREYHRDDREIVFWPSAHYRRWCPLAGPEHVVLAIPGRTPRVVRVQPTDYWYETAPMEESYWQEAVELCEAESYDAAIGALGELPKVAYVGDSPEAAAEAGIPPERVEPEALMAPLDWYRAVKTDHEVERIAAACERAAAGHLAAKQAFEDGASEREAHRAYLAAADQLEREIPYENIIAFDEKSAILHYHGRRGDAAAPATVLLADAGAQQDGYASDLTRTWARPDAEPVFHELLAGVDRLERELVAMVTPGRPYPEIHRAAHRGVVSLLVGAGVLRVSVDEALERGFGGTFMPHGVGHHLGLQVHDVGGQQKGPDGGRVPPDEEIPYLRTTRTLEPGHVVTIEPGLYFIPILLDPLRESDDAAAIDWELVDRLVPCGGIRIEDDIVCTEREPRDLSRWHLPGPGG